MKALAATLQGLGWSDTMVMLYEGCVRCTSMSFTTSPGCCCIGAPLEWFMVMLYEVMLWQCYGYVMAATTGARREAVLWLPCQPGENNCVCSSYGSLSLLPTSQLKLCLPWVQ